MIPGWVTHLGLDWSEPRWVHWFERVTSFARVVRFDKRGTGMSDRTPGVPTPDERMGDARAVMDAAGPEQGHTIGGGGGGPGPRRRAAPHARTEESQAPPWAHANHARAAATPPRA